MLDKERRILRSQALHGALHHPGKLGQRPQIRPGNLLTTGKCQNRIANAFRHHEDLELTLVLEVTLGLAARHLVERWLCDIEMPALDQLRHLPIEERQQQRADMRTVDVGVCHDDDLVIPQLVRRKFLSSDPRAQSRDQRCNFAR